MRVAVLNTGTATVRTALVDAGAGHAAVRVRYVFPLEAGADLREVIRRALTALVETGKPVDAVAHRVVHGGARFTSPVLVSAGVQRSLEELLPLAPVHNAVALAGVRIAREVFPGRPAVAVFDTAFHTRRPPESLRYALPPGVTVSHGLYRYGFHGIAHASLVESLAEAQGTGTDRVTAVTLQLGDACSACAVRAGRSVETSMGYTPLEGLVMPTRSGDVDPALVLRLVRNGRTPEEVEEMLTRKSGLLALGGSADVRELLRRERRGSERAALAIAVFVRRIVLTVGGYLTLLEGRGSLVFGGGIGTNSSEIRARVAAGLGAWDVRLDPARNRGGGPGRISRPGTRPVYVFETDEERLIARSAARLLESTRGLGRLPRGDSRSARRHPFPS